MYVRSTILVKGRIEKRERARRGPWKKARRRISKKKKYTQSRQTREKEIPITLPRRRLQPCRLRLPLLPFPVRTPSRGLHPRLLRLVVILLAGFSPR